MVTKTTHHTSTKSLNVRMTYCSDTITTWSVSCLIVGSLPDCPLDSLSHGEEQKEVKEWSRFWARFEASILHQVGWISQYLSLPQE